MSDPTEIPRVRRSWQVPDSALTVPAVPTDRDAVIRELAAIAAERRSDPRVAAALGPILEERLESLIRSVRIRHGL